MKVLKSVVDLPYITAAGRIVSQLGYDPETQTYLHLTPDDLYIIPEKPSDDDIRAAVKVMMAPLRAYGFASPDDAAGAVSAVMTSIVRPALGLCPGIFFDAPCPGSGKTKAARAPGALIDGQVPAVTPFAGSSTDDELRKRMVAGCLDGVRFHCVDNVVGHLKSSVLAAVLTTGRLADRVLGQTRTVNVDVQALITLTGNNASVDADLQRRLVRVRIDGGDAPTHRCFDFDPVHEALALRRAIAVAVLTVLRGYFNDGAPDIIKGDAGGFADWNRLVRQPVLWLTAYFGPS